MGWKPSARSAAHIACASALFWPALACTSNVLSGALGGGGSDAAPSPDGAVDLGAAPTIDADVAVDAATASDAMVGGDAEVGTDTGSADTGLDSGVDAGMMVDAGTPAGRTFLYIGIAGDAFTDGAWVVMTLDPATGQLTEQSRLVLPAGETGLDGDFPSWGTITSDGRYLLSVREQRGNRPGRLVSYRIDGTTGALTRVDAVDTGRGPVHTAMTSDGSAVLVANISGNSLQVFDVMANGTLGTNPQTIADICVTPHQVVVRGSDVYVPCLFDEVLRHYRYENQQLSPSPMMSSIPINEGTAQLERGPRHMVVAPSGQVAYLLTEFSSRVHVLDRDMTSGVLTPRVMGGQPVAVLALPLANTDPTEYRSSEIIIDATGQWLFAGNRHDGPEGGVGNPADDGVLDSVAVLDIGAGGAPTFRNTVGTGGDVPRSMALTPDEDYLVVGNRWGDDTDQPTLRVFSVSNGTLTQASETTVSFGGLPGRAYFVGAFRVSP